MKKINQFLKKMGVNLPSIRFLLTIALITCFILLLIAPEVHGMSDPPLSNSQFLQTGPDSDGDGLSDQLEQSIAAMYAPLLIYDEGEDEDVANTVVPLYQVSPVKHWSGQDGAILVFTFLYDQDYGADLDQGGWGSVSGIWNSACSLVMDPFDDLFGKHCGDAESIYFFIGQWDNWQSTRLMYITWKRHFDDYYETSETVVSYDDFGSGGNRTHPVIYVSEDKHAMYPSSDECEEYQTDEIKKKTGIGCYPRMEDCDEGTPLRIVNLPQQWNVGESINESTKNHTALNGTIYEGYDPWQNNAFMGRTDDVKVCPGAGGGLEGKWCGSTTTTNSTHPCAGKDWWGQPAAGSACMQNNTDRYGSDYKWFELNDANQCMQACVEDANCVSYSFVKPGYIGSNGMCYLKNSAPAPVFNEANVSGLRSDCLQ